MQKYIFLQKRNYRVLVRICVCASVRVFVFCVCFCTVIQTVIDLETCYLNTLPYENNRFNIEHFRIKVKVTVDLKNFPPYTAVQTVRSYNSLVHARICSSYNNIIYLSVVNA